MRCWFYKLDFTDANPKMVNSRNLLNFPDVGGSVGDCGCV